MRDKISKINKIGKTKYNVCSYICVYWRSNRSLEITRTNGDKMNNGFTGEATTLLRSLINNRQIGISAVDSDKISPQVRFYKDIQGTTLEHTVTDCSVLSNPTNVVTLEHKVSKELAGQNFVKNVCKNIRIYAKEVV